MSDAFSPPPAPTSDAPSEDRTLALVTHLSGIFLGFILPLILWLVNKDKGDKAFLIDQAKEALNFQLTILMGWIAAFFLSFLLIGFLLYPVLMIGNIVLCILAAIKANEGQYYRYPFALRLVK
ncbi:MAG: membrane protein [Silanimonas sp.]|nr:MAG: membrane protein [Silanimonas sp.]